MCFKGFHQPVRMQCLTILWLLTRSQVPDHCHPGARCMSVTYIKRNVNKVCCSEPFISCCINSIMLVRISNDSSRSVSSHQECSVKPIHRSVAWCAALMSPTIFFTFVLEGGSITTPPKMWVSSVMNATVVCCDHLYLHHIAKLDPILRCNCRHFWFEPHPFCFRLFFVPSTAFLWFFTE